MNNQSFYATRLSLILDCYDIKRCLNSLQKKIKVLNSEVPAEAKLHVYLTGKLTKLTPYMDKVLEDVREIHPTP